MHITVPLIKNGRHQPTETVAAFKVFSLQFPSAPKLDLGTSVFTMRSIEPYVESNIQYSSDTHTLFSVFDKTYTPDATEVTSPYTGKTFAVDKQIPEI